MGFESSCSMILMLRAAIRFVRLWRLPQLLSCAVPLSTSPSNTCCTISVAAADTTFSAVCGCPLIRSAGTVSAGVVFGAIGRKALVCLLVLCDEVGTTSNYLASSFGAAKCAEDGQCHEVTGGGRDEVKMTDELKESLQGGQGRLYGDAALQKVPP